MPKLLTIILFLLPSHALSDVTCGAVQCSSPQACCADKTSCCLKDATSTLAAVLCIMFVVCLTATGLGICLYFKKRVHKDTGYTPDDIEGMYAHALYKEISCRVEPVSGHRLSSSCEPQHMMTYEDVPVITPTVQRTDLAAVPGGGTMYANAECGTAGGGTCGTPIASRVGSVGTLISSEHVMCGPGQSMVEKVTRTESTSTQVTSAKRTVVTVNLNMKEKENIKLNIFMNKDQFDGDPVDEDSSFPRGLTAKRSRKRSAKRSSSSTAERVPVRQTKSTERRRSKSPVRPKTPTKEKLSVKFSSGKKKKTKS